MEPSRAFRSCCRLVLAVDDEEDHLLAYEMAFGRERDLRLLTAKDTREARIALAAHPVDAVLLDLLVPADGGIALCRRIKSQARLRHVPVIALSALPAELYAAPALDAGCCAFLQKPCSLSTIVAEVRRHLGNAIIASHAVADEREPKGERTCG